MKILSWNCRGVGNLAIVHGGVFSCEFGKEKWWHGADVEGRRESHAWDMLRRVKSTVNEGWIVGGDFNAILNDFEKEGGRRKPRALMDEFGDILKELSLTDVKNCNGWFTWTNNRDGNRLVKERLDRFVISDYIMVRMQFLASYIVRQSKSDHEAILMDLYGNKSKEKGNNPMVWFRYDLC
ncbi:hypothetical protein GOBAR_DD24346 [Gossypium barbadense]|nr:hypothetical protein GOBAR_DD24346 [Gossypium barbadense]